VNKNVKSKKKAGKKKKMRSFPWEGLWVVGCNTWTKSPIGTNGEIREKTDRVHDLKEKEASPFRGSTLRGGFGGGKKI